MHHLMSPQKDARRIWSAKGNVKHTGVISGTSNWKQGSLEIFENSAGQVFCVMNFDCGRPKTFTLTNNIKGTTIPMSMERCVISLKDSSIISICKAPQQGIQALGKLIDDVKMASKRAAGQTPSSNGVRDVGATPPSQKGTQRLKSSPVSEPAKLQTHVRWTSPLRKNENTTPKKSSQSIHAGEFEAQVPGSFPLFKEEVTDEADSDKENEEGRRPDTHQSIERNSVYQFRKEGGGSLFKEAYKEKENLLAEKKSNTPNIQAISSNFYGRGSQMLSYAAAENFRLNRSAPPKSVFPTRNFNEKERKTFQFRSKRFSFKHSSLFTHFSPKTLQGFSNLGNTCYMNAILQALFGLESFSKDLLNVEILKNLPDKSLYGAMAFLLLAKQQEKPRDVVESKLRNVKVAISQTATRFSGFLQHDAHEFLCQCLDQLKEEADRLNKATADIHGVPMNSDIPPPHFSSTTERNLEFIILHTIRCVKCHETVTKEEEFHDLSLETPRRSELHDTTIQVALDQFLQEEEIEYTCEKCQCNQAVLSHKFTKLPRYLILHLKRYTYDAESSSNAKSQRRIKIPHFLTLERHHQSTKEQLTLINKVLNDVDKNLSKPSDGDDKAIRKRLSYEMDRSTENDGIESKRTKHQEDPIHILDEEGGTVTLNGENLEPETNPKSFQEMSEEEQIAYAIEISQRESVKPSIHLLPDVVPLTGEATAIPKSFVIDGDRSNSQESNNSFNHHQEDQRTPLIGGFMDRGENPIEKSDETSSIEFVSEEPYKICNDTEETEPHQDENDKIKELESESESNKFVFKFGDRKNTSGDGEAVRNCSRDSEGAANVEKGSDEENQKPSLEELIAKEEEDMERATKLSLQEALVQEKQEEEELRKAQEMSLREYQKSSPESFVPKIEDASPSRPLYSEEDWKELARNAEDGHLPNSYQLTGVVSHIGSSSSTGHYLSDVYSEKSQSWLSYDDSDVRKISGFTVREERQRTGYIFFYKKMD